MTQINVPNRTLFHGDNLDFLRGVNSGAVHLIATDPPFNKGDDFHATPGSPAAGTRFSDRWQWDQDVMPEWCDAIQSEHHATWNIITAARPAAGEDMATYLCWLGVRLLEMHRVLRSDGSIYIHTDDTAHAWVKVLLDSIFGRANFRNEIVWQRRTDSHNLPAGHMGRIHDTILFYAKSPSAKYRVQLSEYEDAYIATHYKHTDAVGRYRLLPCNNESGGNRVYRFRGVEGAWRYSRDTMQSMYDDGMLVQLRADSVWYYKKYLKDAQGVKLQDLWTDVPGVRGSEDTGYPTQKPLALYERIIKSSSTAGDIVLDPFAGSATTLVAAERLDRQWFGMDVWDGAHGVVIERLQAEGLAVDGESGGRLITLGDVRYSQAPPIRTDQEVEKRT